jgi:hypothetical protein
MVTYALTALCAGGVTVGVGTPLEAGALVDELGADDVGFGDELVVVELGGSVGEGEYDCVCGPPLLLHAAKATVAEATIAANTSRRDICRLPPGP